MSSVAVDTINALITSLQSVAGLNGKTFHILTEAELMDRSRLIPSPSVGVLYEGMRSTGTGGGTHRTGLSAELSAALVVYYRNATPLGQAGMDAQKPVAIEMLDAIRNQLRDTRGPGGHYWRFLSESPALEKDGLVVWIQRWSTPVMLSQGL